MSNFTQGRISNYFIIFIFGLVVGGICCWYIQNETIKRLKEIHANFVEHVKQQGELAQKFTDEQIARHKKMKDRADDEYKITISNLKRDVSKLRNARASSNFLPSNSNSSADINSICIDRDQVERALQQFDDEVTTIVSEGDEAVVKFTEIQKWYSSLN